MKTINAKGKMKNGLRVSRSVEPHGRDLSRTPKWKILRFAICTLQFAIFVSACGSAFQVGTEIQAGRYAMLTGKPDMALPHFSRAAELDANYRLDFSPFQEGVWTYVGRAYYDTGKFSEARQALERARSRYDDDQLAKIYLGLVLARDGDRERGLKELQGGMRGLHDWLEHIVYNTEYGQYWDPNREIRSEIQRNLAVATGREPDLKSLIANAEWLGKRMEDEIDLARRNEVMERMRPGDNTEP